MTTISLIAAMDEAGGIGRNNQLLCHLPADLKHFKTITLGKPIIMGRNTFESIGKPLPGRLNIVLSRTLSIIEGILIFDSLEKALDQVQDMPEVMIIGGAELYNQTLSQANRLYITVIHHRFDADVFFPKIDPAYWVCATKEFCQKDDRNAYDMTYISYEKNKIKSSHDLNQFLD